MSKETDLRLKYWLSDQSDRERMCLAILSLDKRFMDVRPRRPKGGPDGGRDIEAFYGNSNYPIYGAVGFKSNALDSNEDKRWLKSKFKSDLNSALKTNPQLYGFIFFTNLDVTPTELTMFNRMTIEKNLHFFDIYYRERIMIALNTPEGFGIRFQYLNIYLTDAEQASFFSQRDKNLNLTIMQGFSSILNKLNKLEYFHDLPRKVGKIKLEVFLNNIYDDKVVGLFGITGIIFIVKSQQFNSLYMAAKGRNDPQLVSTYGQLEKKSFKHMYSFRSKESIGCSIDINNLKDISLNLEDFDQTLFSLLISDNILNEISKVRLIVDEYILFEGILQNLNPIEQHPDNPIFIFEKTNLKWRGYSFKIDLQNRIPQKTDYESNYSI